MTLAEVKKELRLHIKELKDSLYSLRHEHEGVDPHSGHYTRSGRFEMKVQLEIQLDIYRSILKQLCTVKKLK